MDKYNTQELKKSIDNFSTLSKTEALQLCMFLLALCEIDIITTFINVGKNTVSSKPLFITNVWKDEYFNKGLLRTIHNIIETTTDDYTKKVFEIVSETFDFIDQLPYENLLEDTIEAKNEILLKIKIARNTNIGLNSFL